MLDGSITSGSELRFQTGADQNDATMLNSIANLNALGSGGLELGEQANVAADGGTVIGSASVQGSAYEGTDLNSNVGELSAGDYIVKVNYSADGVGSTVQLYDASDTAMANPLEIDADGSVAVDGAAEATDSAITVDLSGGGATLNLGNGMEVSVGAFATAGPQTATVFGFSPSTTAVELKTSTGDTIDENATAAQFAQYMADIEGKLNSVSEELSKLGSLTGRLTFKEDQISAAQINTEAAYNRIMNANMAEEQVNASKYQILQQTSTAMLAQANAAPQFLLSLFR